MKVTLVQVFKEENGKGEEESLQKGEGNGDRDKGMKQGAGAAAAGGRLEEDWEEDYSWLTQ